MRKGNVAVLYVAFNAGNYFIIYGNEDKN